MRSPSSRRSPPSCWRWRSRRRSTSRARILVPIAFAIILSFLLAPLVRLVQRPGIPRSVAVVGVVLLAVGGLITLGGVMAGQMAQLAAELPQHRPTMEAKVRSLRGATLATGALGRTIDMLEEMAQDLQHGSPTVPESDARPASRPSQPVPVEVLDPEAGPLETLGRLAWPLLSPLATAGLIVVFAVFILVQREDLRNRMIRLAGTSDLQKTTAAIDDAASRLSRLFLTQLAVNAGFGLVVATGLWLIGVPSPALWGILGAALRFVPYVGALIAAAFPAAVAAIVDPGWSMLAWTAALFLLVEAAVGQRPGAPGLRAQQRAVARSGHARGHGLGLPVGAGGPHPRHAAHRLPRRPRPPHRPAPVPRRHAGRPAAALAAADLLPAHAGGRPGRGRGAGARVPEAQGALDLLRRGGARGPAAGAGGRRARHPHGRAPSHHPDLGPGAGDGAGARRGPERATAGCGGCRGGGGGRGGGRGPAGGLGRPAALGPAPGLARRGAGPVRRRLRPARGGRGPHARPAARAARAGGAGGGARAPDPAGAGTGHDGRDAGLPFLPRRAQHGARPPRGPPAAPPGPGRQGHGRPVAPARPRHPGGPAARHLGGRAGDLAARGAGGGVGPLSGRGWARPGRSAGRRPRRPGWRAAGRAGRSRRTGSRRGPSPGCCTGGRWA